MKASQNKMKFTIKINTSCFSLKHILKYDLMNIFPNYPVSYCPVLALSNIL